MLRAPALSIDGVDDLRTEVQHPAGDPASIAADRFWEAVDVASAGLFTALRLGGRPGERSPADALAAADRYAIRMSSRPTPYGLFAGVAVANFGDMTDLRISAPLKSRSRPDGAWLTALVDGLERRPDARRRLTVMANPTIAQVGGRVQAAELARSGGQSGDIAASAAVRAALSAAAAPVRWTDLSAHVVQELGADPADVQTVLDSLFEAGFLMSDLHPPLTMRSPTDYVLDRIAGVPDAAAEAKALTGMSTDLADFDTGAVGHRRESLTSARSRARAAVDGFDGDLVQVDAALQLNGTVLERRVGRDAAALAWQLLRLAPRDMRLDAFRTAFVDRHGADGEVPLTDLMNSADGMGLPTSLSRSQFEPRIAAHRNELLHQHVAGAMRDGRTTVVLTGDEFAELAVEDIDDDAIPQSLDLSVFVLARSMDGIDRGEYRVAVGPNLGGQAAGRNIGRFTDILGARAAQALDDVARAEGLRSGDGVHAELLYTPRHARSVNVALREHPYDHEISVSAPARPGTRAIPLSELVVTAASGSLEVRWARTGTPVYVHSTHMLNRREAPAVVSFLEDVTRGDRRVLQHFDWGTASAMPFLPRVEYGRSVLSPATWRVDQRTRDALSGSTAPKLLLDAWRAKWLVPPHVYLAMGDNRLLLDLGRTDDLEHLVAEARRPGTRNLVLQEALPAPEHAWLTGPEGRYVPELIVPLVRTLDRSPRAAAAPSNRSMDAPRPVSTPLADRSRRKFPGTDWLHLRLDVQPEDQDDLLIRDIADFAAFAQNTSIIDRWFFVRYADPLPHLRVRFHGHPRALVTELLPELLAWANDLVERRECSGFSLDTYEREITRYGGVDALDACESVFAVDSEMTIELIRAIAQDADRVELAVLSCDDLLAAFQLEASDRLGLLRRSVQDRRDSSAAYRERQRDLRALLSGDGDALSTPAGAASTHLILRERRRLLSPYAAKLLRLGADRRLGRPLTDVLASVLHLHLNRLLGPTRHEEQLVLGLLLRTEESLERYPVRRE